MKITEELQRLLLSVERPIRYTDGEYNVIRKSHEGKVLFLLAFPDIYEVGMSNYGLRLLYYVINKHRDGVAERVFLPWHDMKDAMERAGIPLHGIESGKPAKEYDIVGFSLQSELSYTNVLLMLSLAGIPLKSEERGEDDPVVIAGGPCTVNPAPLMPFFDAFVVGDGEEVVLKIIEVFKSLKGEKRSKKLESLSKIEGVFVPGISKEVKRTWVRRLTEDNAPYPPVVPISEIVHDRLVVEVARGCTRGCRFCQAGFINRPTRFRNVDEIVRIAERSVRASGWEEVSLLSFSISDYPYFEHLLKRLNQILQKRKVAISLPSMRGESFTPVLASTLREIKKTGLTFAVETASARLRKVINKDYPLESIREAILSAIKIGWKRVKMYYMVGLPTETMEDVEDSFKFFMDIYGMKKGISYTVHISPFVPKPHTPFQWTEFRDIEYLNEAIRVFSRVKKRNISLRYNSPEVAMIEAILSRGDEKLASVIEDVYRMGGVYQDWSEFFDIKKWKKAFQNAGLEMSEYLRKRELDEPLPWDFVNVGVSKPFLKLEYKKAMREETTPDCFELKCTGCGGCEGKLVLPSPSVVELSSGGRYPRKVKLKSEKKFVVRLKYALGENFRYAGHLDVVRTIYRVLRRSELPIAYSEGFSPKPRISFGPPLSVGIVSKSEYMDITMTQFYRGNIVRDLSPHLPEDMMIVDSAILTRKVPSLSSSINIIQYEFNIPEETDPGYIVDKGNGFPFIYAIDVMDRRVSFFLKLEDRVKVYSAVAQLLDISEDEARKIPLTRVEMYIYKDKKLYTPMGII